MVGRGGQFRGTSRIPGSPGSAGTAGENQRTEIRKEMPVYIAEAWGAKDPGGPHMGSGTAGGERALCSRRQGAGTRSRSRPCSQSARQTRQCQRPGEAGWNVLWPWALRAPDKAFEEMTKNGAAWPDRLAYGVGDAMARHDAARAAEAAHTMPPGRSAMSSSRGC